MRIGILAYNGCTATMITGVVDILSFANAKYKSTSKSELFEVEIITERGEAVNGFSQFPIQSQRSTRSRRHYDLIYVPGFVGDVEDLLLSQKGIIKWLRHQHEEGVVLTAACNGNFLLAESGVLNGKLATTHWSLIGVFRNRYPGVTLKPERVIIDNGSVVSAAGVTACFNLALFVVERFGSKELALTSAKIFLVDSGRKVQTPYQVYQVSKNHGDEEIVKVQNWLEQKINDNITIQDMLTVSNLGRKTLVRRFKKMTGETPLVYVRKLRIENAKRLLESKSLSFSEITWKVGYSDASSFHKLFKSETGLTPIEYRAKFAMI